MDNRLMNVSRRNFGLFAGAALPAMAIGTAKADTPFTSFAFPATGALSSRNEPDRWSDWHNVLDFGADPTGVTDSTSAIQAAINWTSNGQRGTIYFPRGLYTVSGSLSLYFGTGANQSIILRGDGVATRIQGNVSGYLFDRYDPSWATVSGIIVIEKMYVLNTNTTVGTGAIRLGNCNSAVVRDCVITGMNGVVLNQTDVNPAYLSNNCSIINCNFAPLQTRGPGTNAVVTGNGTTIMNMDCGNWDCAVRLCGTGSNIVSGRFEVNNYGIIFGVDQFGNAVPAKGCSVGGFSMESNAITHIDVVNATGCVLYECGGAAYNGAAYGLRLRSGVSQIVLLSCSFSGGYSTAAVSIEDSSGTPGTGNTFIGCSASNSTGGAVAWAMPTRAATARFINSTNPAAIFTYGNLPSSGMVFGDEYIISNSSLATTSGNFGSPASGGGSNTAKVRWNGTSWIMV